VTHREADGQTTRTINIAGPHTVAGQLRSGYSNVVMVASNWRHLANEKEQLRA